MGDVPRHAQERVGVTAAKARLLDAAPTVAELQRDAVDALADSIRRRPWTAVAVAAGLGAFLTVSPRTRRAALKAAQLALPHVL